MVGVEDSIIFTINLFLSDHTGTLPIFEKKNGFSSLTNDLMTRNINIKCKTPLRIVKSPKYLRLKEMRGE